MPLPGVEPGPRPSEGRVPSVTRQGRNQSRRPGSNRHEPAYRAGASPFGHVGRSRGARIRTLSARFGGSLLSQEHTPVFPWSEGIRRELNPAPRDSHSRMLPLHHEHHQQAAPRLARGGGGRGGSRTRKAHRSSALQAGPVNRSGSPSISSLRVGDAGVEPAASSVSCWRSDRLS